MCDLLWSVPINEFGQERTTENFVHNHVRRRSYLYTYKAVCNFLEPNRLVSIICAYKKVHKAGSVESFYVSLWHLKFLLVRIVYRYCMYRKHNGHPSVITVFSAPNYLDVHLNQAAVLRVKHDGEKPTVLQFNWGPHSFQLPNFMDAFSWSIPFICEKGGPAPHTIMFDVD